MCGIAGCFGTKDEKTINRMLDAMGHRGPNDRGIHDGNHFTIGHTRLSIVDVATGHQPILTADGKKGIIANGEIYNFKELKSELESTYTFKTKSDSETVLHGTRRNHAGGGHRSEHGDFQRRRRGASEPSAFPRKLEAPVRKPCGSRVEPADSPAFGRHVPVLQGTLQVPVFVHGVFGPYHQPDYRW